MIIRKLHQEATQNRDAKSKGILRGSNPYQTGVLIEENGNEMVKKTFHSPDHS